MMTQTEKRQIQARLAAFCNIKGGQNQAANILRGVSAATLSHALNNKWELISDEMWRTIATQVGYDPRAWAVVETRGYMRMTELLSDAQQSALVFAVVGEAGCGKSEAIRSYAAHNGNVFVLSCSEYWNRKHFMVELLQCMGIDSTGSTVPEMIADIILALKKKAAPLVILDEADKLSDQLLYFFITLYNQLEDQVGIILCATDYLEKRIRRGVRINSKGYKEIFSRCGRRFIPLQVVNAEDVAAVCVANGVDDPKTIRTIADDCENDFRRVKRKVYAIKKCAERA